MDIMATPPRALNSLASSSGVKARKFADRTATVVLWCMASSIILLLAAFIIYMFWIGARYLTPAFIFGLPAETSAGGGIGPEIYNSFYILILTLIFTVPIATAAGVYLQEYARPGRFRELVVFSAESLATVPSIVMGLFGLLVFVYLFKWKFTALGGALTLTLLNLPALMRVTQEALSSVPDSFREASMGIGATKWQTILRVVLPNALPPVIVAATLAIGVAILFEGGLSFLGIGDPNTMSWGLMIGENRNYVLDGWWTVTFPGAAIFVAVLAISLIGDGINDALNPRLRRRS